MALVSLASFRRFSDAPARRTESARRERRGIDVRQQRCLFVRRLAAHIARYDGNSVLLVCADVSTKRHLVAAK